MVQCTILTQRGKRDARAAQLDSDFLIGARSTPSTAVQIHIFIGDLRSEHIAPFQTDSATKLTATMKVLLIGATGNLGLRLIAALLTHGHIVVAFVRSSSKLESLVPASIYQQVSVVEGDAKDSASIKRAILENSCDAAVNTAGVAALPPWGNSDLPAIFRAVLDGVREAGSERKKPLRTWFLAGLGVLHYPGTDSMLSS